MGTLGSYLTAVVKQREESEGGRRGSPGPARPPGPRGVGSAPRPSALAASPSESGGGGGGAAASGYVGAPERADPEAAVRLWSSAPGPGPRPGPAGCFPRSRTGTCGNPRRRCWTPARTRSPDSSTSASLSVRRSGGGKEWVSGGRGSRRGKDREFGGTGWALGREADSGLRPGERTHPAAGGRPPPGMAGPAGRGCSDAPGAAGPRGRGAGCFARRFCTEARTFPSEGGIALVTVEGVFLPCELFSRMHKLLSCCA